MKTLLLSLAGAFMALILFFLIVPIIVISMLAPSSEPVRPDGPLVLSMDLRAEYSDRAPTDGLGALFGGVSFIDILTRLDAAAADPDVAGVVLRASEYGLGSTRAEELRDAILKLKANGKFVMAHSQGVYVGGPSAYRAVSASDEIWMQEGSELAVPGVSLESMFFKGLLEKIGVTPEIIAFYEFKNAPNAFTEAEYTASHELALRAYADDIWRITIEDVYADRAQAFRDRAEDLTPDADDALAMAHLRDVLEDSPYSAEAAVSLGLVDKLGWPEDMERAAKARADGDIIDIAQYAPPAHHRGAAVIALVAGEGAIVTGQSGGDLFSPGSDNVMASDTVAEQIYKAGDDPDVRAILFRVDSPGGSATASDQIWRAIRYVQTEKNKPVVVSMGAYAASGGYYVSMGADKIVASRTTLTGSIGVFGGRFAIAEGLEKIGVTTDSIDIGGPFASAFTSVEPMSNAQREKMYTMLKRTYDRFTMLVAEGRNMTVEEAHERARGRIWSGVDAKEEGLVDELGGLIRAIEVAKEIAGVEADKPIELRNMEPKPDPMEVFSSMFAASEAETRAMRAAAGLITDKRVSAALNQFEAMRSEPRQASMIPMIER